MPPSTLDRLRTICTALPEAQEDDGGVGAPAFKVRGKNFALHYVDHHGDGRGQVVWCKAPPGEQAGLVGSEPERYFVPPYVGVHGWVGVKLSGGVDWDMVEELVRDSFRLVAPKRLAAQVD